MSQDMDFALSLTLVGLTIVFGVLLLMSAVIALVRRGDEGWKLEERAREVERLEKEPSIDATTAVLIAAAVATYVGGRYRIRSVRRLLPRGGSASAWSSQGRAVLQGSHTISRKNR